MKTSALIFSLLVLFFISANAATYYIAPTGNDASTGTSTGASWKTFAFAIPKLKAGDVLILLDGIYDATNSGYPNFTNVSGTAAQPITVKVQNERKAFIKGNGSVRPVIIQSSHYLTLEGLRVEEGDIAGASGGSVVLLKGSDHITIRRFLLNKDNRYQNSALILLDNTNYSLFEENELYTFHRLGIQVTTGNSNTFRRNYANSRAHSDIAGGYPSANGEDQRGDVGFVLYTGSGASNNVYENNISEGNGAGFHLNAYYCLQDRIQYYGNMSLDDTQGMFTIAGSTAGQMSTNTTVENHVVIQAREHGFHIGSAYNFNCRNVTVLNSKYNGVLVYKITSSPGSGQYSFFGKNILTVGNVSKGIRVTTDIQTWSAENVNAYQNPTMNFDPATSSNYTNGTSLDPKLGACKVWIPDSSPMKRAGKGGADVGANVLYRYKDGILTNEPLWDPTNGEFPHGVIIAGINDIPGQSLFDVHKRLNVNCNNCPFPASYPKPGTSAVTPARSENSRQQDFLSITPNLSGSSFSINTDPNHSATIEVFNLQGKRVDQFKNVQGNSIRWQRGSRPAGVYFVKASSNGITATAKILAGN